ncbi:hypothetical protein CF326_g1341 [Tilletia indica]|nr:hypothetical protein CF326_g1341 [Tilletia indica]
MKRLRQWVTFAPAILAFVGSLAPAAAQPLLTGYWTDWTAAEMPPESVDMTRFDIINFAFGLPTPAFDITFNSAQSTAMLQRLVAAALKANTGTRVVLSIGGWLSSQHFSAAVATDASRLTFAQNINRVMQLYKLDGVDMDWEYPGSAGAGNPFSPSDADNFQIFLRTLRLTLGPSAILTVTVSHEPWDGPSGQPIPDVSITASAVDAVLIMNYDVNQGVAGVNAPLADLCGNSTQPRANAAAGVKQWVAAGMPREKIILGVPAYGYVQVSTSTTLPQRRDTTADAIPGDLRPRHSRFRPRYNATLDERQPEQQVQQQRASTSAASYPSSRRTLQIKRQTTSAEGQITFKALLQQGILTFYAPDETYIAAPSSGYTKYWDICTDTPYLSNGQRIISYDDPQSLRDKASFALKAGLAGVGVWSVDADTKDYALMTALQQGLGR